MYISKKPLLHDKAIFMRLFVYLLFFKSEAPMLFRCHQNSDLYALIYLAEESSVGHDEEMRDSLQFDANVYHGTNVTDPLCTGNREF